MFGPNSSQAEVYSHCVEPLLCRVLNGQNASVFAYGPTGSGMNTCVNLTFVLGNIILKMSNWEDLNFCTFMFGGIVL